jgi:lysophospholipase L1-like esterase
VPFRIVTLGDSIIWGQGLLDSEKFAYLVQQALLPGHPGGVTIEPCAHSGAVIGVPPETPSGGPFPYGEVPASLATIIQQCDGFANAPDAVDLVLLNGGINDVGVATILNPLAVIPSLGSKVESACLHGMQALLRKVAAKFNKPSCRILVTGYYTIFSSKSDPLHLHKLMSLHGIGAPAFLAQRDLVNLVVSRCEQFFQKSTDNLQAAIGLVGDARIMFVPSGFVDDNAIFATSSYLWGLDDLLNPEDPMAEVRQGQCNLSFPGLLEIAHREECYRASAGHPNIQGAQQYARQIRNVLGI